MNARFTALLVLGLPGMLTAQAATTRAVGSITEADVRNRISILAHDSMGGRNTPSPGLTKAANYIAREFKRLGLKPGGDQGGFMMQYPIQQRRLLAGASSVTIVDRNGRSVKIGFGADLALAGRSLPSGSGQGAIALVGGNGSFDSLPRLDLRDKIVLFVTDWARSDANSRFTTMTRLARDAGARGIIALVNSDSVVALRYGQSNTRNYQVVGGQQSTFYQLVLRDAAIASQIPEAADQLALLRAAPSAVLLSPQGAEASVSLRDTLITEVLAPNVVGILEGTDPVLKNEYLVYSAHMDHVGTAGQPGASCRGVGADSICNGADDDASGTAAVLELAEAYATTGARPKRSVIFLTVSGEEHGLWGSEWFVNHPPVPLPQIVANLNADMIGRNWADTIVAIGKEHSDLGATLKRVNSAHPELNMVAIDDRWPDQNFYGRSDHYNFARKGVPILFFFNGVHADYHRPSDSVEKIDAEKEARIVKLLFYVGRDVANAAKRPEWAPASYRSIVTP